MTKDGRGSAASRRSPLPRFDRRVNVGAYRHPRSGVGMEYAPLGEPPHAEITLHETGYWPTSYAWNYPNVFSPFWRITYDFEPGHFVEFGDRRIPLGPEYLCVIPDHQRFSCVGDKPVATLWFLFSCTWAIAPETRMPILIRPDKVLLSMIEEFPALFRDRSPNKESQIRRLSLALLTYILGDRDIPRRKELPCQIASAVQAINDAPAHPWSNPELARLVAMSTEGFIRAFRRSVGETPIQYVQQVRIQKACRLLADPALSMEQVAELTGFSDRFYFTRVFKKQTNVTPAKYRKQLDAAPPSPARNPAPSMSGMPGIRNGVPTER